MSSAEQQRTAHTVAEVVSSQKWLDPIGDLLQQPVERALDAIGVEGRNALHGTWLGHPLHPALTDVPIGAWTAALALDAADAAGVESAGKGADIAVAVGLAGAAASAVTGLADWSQTSGHARRTGVAHASANIIATLLYSTSLAMRLSGARRGARIAAAAGYAAVMAGAFLGGHLVFGHQIGVDHTATADAGKPKEFVPVIREDALTGDLTRVEADGVGIVLVRTPGGLRAMSSTCPHLGGPLDEGRLVDGTLRCPWHGSRFAIDSGTVVEGPSAYAAPCFDLRIREGMVEVRARE